MMRELEVLEFVWVMESSRMRRWNVWGPQPAIHFLPTGLSAVREGTEGPKALNGSFFI